MNAALLEFWQEHGRPGRVGLFHLDFAPAKLVNWGQKRLTLDGKPSPWVHSFLFIEPRDGVPWIAESDMSLPLPGLRKPINGPQLNSVAKWSGMRVDRAAVLDPHLTNEQYERARSRAEELLHEHYFYSLTALAGTWIAILKNDLRHHSLLHRDKGMHCSQFVRTVMGAAGADFLGDEVSLENTAPEMLYQRLDIVGEWKRN